MSRNNLKRIIVGVLSGCMLLSQVNVMAFATETTSETEYETGYRELEPVDSSFAGVTSKWDLLKAESLAASYCSSADFPVDVEQRKDVVTSVKFQEYGTCWAHAAISVAETSYIINEGKNPDNTDFNEFSLVHYANNAPADSLNLFGGDYNYNTDPNILDTGGNNRISLYSFAAWQGATDALDSQYGPDNINTPPENLIGYDDVAHLKDGYILTMPDMTSSDYQADMNIIKEMIMKYGSVTISYYSDWSSLYFRGCYQYNDTGHETDHSVTVVGWDDTIAASNFVTAPAGNGAWIVKNSWGSSWAANGYFYLSYYDTTIAENAFAFNFVKGDNYDNNYQYDGTSCYNAVVDSHYGQVTAANAFVADSNETLEAVGLFTNKINTNYKIQVYRNLGADEKPGDGTLVFTKTGTLKYVGYHTVDLETAIPVTQGERYAVVVSYINENGGYVSFPVDQSTSGGWILFSSLAKAGESYAGEDVNSLEELNPRNTDDHYMGTNVRIKAFTNEAEGEETTAVSSVILDKTTLQIEKNETQKLTVSVLPSTATNVKVTWSSSDESVATVDQKGNVYGVAGGTATITAMAQDGSGKKATCQVSVKEVWAQDLAISVYGNEVSYHIVESIGNTFQFETIFTPDDTTNKNVIWTSSNTSVLSIGENGQARAVGQGYAVVTATTTDGSNLSAKCLVAVQKILINSMSIYSNGAQLGEYGTYTGAGVQKDLDVVVDPQEALDLFGVTWESSDESVVTVDQNGVITTVAPGEAMITARLNVDYFESLCTTYYYVTVNEQVINVSNVFITQNGSTAPDSMVIYGTNNPIYFGASVRPTNATNQEVTWSSSNTSIAYVYQSGEVNFYSYGTVTITAKAKDTANRASDSITITVKPTTYTINFNGNGATSGSMNSMTCNFGTDYQLTTNRFVRTGHRFLYWNTRADGTGMSYLDGSTVSNLSDQHGASITLYVQWWEEDPVDPNEPVIPDEPIPVPDKPYKIANVVSGTHVYWTAISGATKYGLWRSENGVNGTYKWIANPTVPHFTDVTVKTGKTYYYKVTVYDVDKQQHGEKSEPIGLAFVSTPDISSRFNKGAGVQLGWEPIEGATGYAIYRKTYSGTDAWTRIATIFGTTTLTYMDTTVKNDNGKIYRYTIRALIGNTLSGCRSSGRTMVRLSSRTMSSATKASATSITCKWTTSTAVTGYEVRFMIGDKVHSTITIGNNKTGQKTFTGLPKGNTYKVQVRAYKKVDGVGSFYSAWSEPKYVVLN